MKIKHKIPLCAYRSDPITPEYQAEVDRSTNKAMLEYAPAQRRLEAAERRLRKAEEASRAAGARKKVKATAARELAVAAELVELRREELQRLEALMKNVPASAEHRGKRSYRPVPQPGRQV